MQSQGTCAFDRKIVGLTQGQKASVGVGSPLLGIFIKSEGKYGYSSLSRTIIMFFFVTSGTLFRKAKVSLFLKIYMYLDLKTTPKQNMKGTKIKGQGQGRWISR